MMEFLSSVESVLSIVLIIFLGYYLSIKGFFSEDFGNNISKLIINVALPAAIFHSVLTHLSKDTLLSLTGGLIYGGIAVTIGYLLSWILVKLLKIPNGRRGIFINTVVNANTIFIGMPLNIALFGQDSIPYYLVYYVINTVSTWTIGAYLIAEDPMDSSESHKKKAFSLKKLLPAPIIGFILAVAFLLIEIPVPAFISSSLGYVGSIVTPLSLVYIGIVLAKAGLKSIRFDKDTIAGLLGKFILAPAIIVLLIVLGSSVLPLPALEAKTLILQASVPALTILPILANEAKGDVKYATSIVTTSTLLFILVIPVVDELLTMFYG